MAVELEDRRTVQVLKPTPNLTTKPAPFSTITNQQQQPQQQQWPPNTPPSPTSTPPPTSTKPRT
ncbi:hypothetical protein BJ508DRAFT_326469 [Ascobolus immersus RN42]|uniref:Uncharacterized protein n=1 Tax=Ascobolus immersus RN42 TaxID=1160509 RepID=A0A3N4I5G7_ASCIM|nr:hypothetical protein BJ508DRAFT_326469 [Ascobolus immersus RN42]